jgi:predicted nucleotidyltransferase component of viral defense system
MKDLKQINDIFQELIGCKIIKEEKSDLSTLIQMNNIKGFNPRLLEKDFRLTMILIYLAKTVPELRFKGGTCLNKVYYPYFRLSEDLDFTLPIDEDFVNSNGKREKFAHKMRTAIKRLTTLMERELNPDQEQHKKALGLEALCNKEYTYLKYVLSYPSLIDDTHQNIKIEVTYTPKQYFQSCDKKIQSLFIDPLFEAPLFMEQKIQCLALEEMVTEKCRAALTRRIPAIRDFFDLWYLQKQGIDIFSHQEVIIQKCKEITE